MGTNQYDVQKKQMKAQAKETRRQAGIAYKSGMEQAQGVTEDSNASLSQAMALLGKTGSLGVSNDAIDYEGISSGVDTGGLKGDSVLSLEKKSQQLTEDLSKQAAKVATAKEEDSDRGGLDLNIEQVILNKQSKKLEKTNKNLAKITGGLDKIGDISAGETANLTSGSTALNLKTFQDKLTKARNRYVNQVQEDVYSALLNAENADSQANLAGKASGWHTFNTILDIGTTAAKIAGMP